MFGGFAVVKLFLLVLGLSVVEYTYNTTFAQLASWCVLTWQYYTWEYQTWGYITGQELTWGSLIDCILISWYWTGGALDEFGVLTWQNRVEETQTGCVLSGQTLTEGYMTGYYLTWWYRTWGYITWCIAETGSNQMGNNQTGSNQTGTNQTGSVPTLTWMTLLTNWVTTWYLTISGVVTLRFIASQELSGVQVTLWSGKLANSSTISWLLYIYTRNLSSWYFEGPLAANIAFVGISGNTASVLYTWWLIFDITKPVVTGFIFSGYTGGAYLNFFSSELVRYTFSYGKIWWNSFSGANADYLTAQQLNFSWIENDQTYLFTINIYDRAGNLSIVTGDFLQATDWTIIFHVYLVSPINTEVLTWNLSSLAVILKAEVEKFNVCKNALSYTPIELDVKNNKFMLQMPIFKKSQVKTLVNAFTLFVLDKVKNNHEMTSDDITEITKKFDSFLVILKLLRDDDNICKQNLSNYHISQFRKILEEYKISLE